MFNNMANPSSNPTYRIWFGNNFLGKMSRTLQLSKRALLNCRRMASSGEIGKHVEEIAKKGAAQEAAYFRNKNAEQLKEIHMKQSIQEDNTENIIGRDKIIGQLGKISPKEPILSNAFAEPLDLGPKTSSLATRITILMKEHAGLAKYHRQKAEKYQLKIEQLQNPRKINESDQKEHI